MQVDVRATLRFQHRAGLEKGIVAFDASAYPEFFKSELWTVAGTYAWCDRSFEIEPDCDYKAAFLAMASAAVEGTVDLKEHDRKPFVQIMKLPKTTRWMVWPRDNPSYFGQQPAAHRTAWAEAIEQAKADDVVKAEQVAKKAAKDGTRCQVVELPRNPTHVVRRPDGSFAVAAGSAIVFVAPTGEVMSQSECAPSEYSMFAAAGISSLHVRPDGKVLAFQDLGDNAALASPGEPVAEVVTGKNLRGAASDDTTTIVRSNHAFTLGTREITPWPDDYLDGAIPWRGGALAWKSLVTRAYDANGTQLWEVPSSQPIPFAGGVALKLDRTITIVDDGGTVQRTIEVGNVYHRRGWGVVRGTHLVTTTSGPDLFGEWDLATGTPVWCVKKTHKVAGEGFVLGDGWAVTWASEPVAGALMHLKDTTIAAYREGVEFARVDAKATVLGGVAIGDHVACFCDGRTAGTKVLLWRDLSGTPRLASLTGHKGRVRGVLDAGDGRIVSWAADKTLRIWRT